MQNGRFGKKTLTNYLVSGLISQPFSKNNSQFNMFSKLFDLRFKRTAKQAFGFYIVYLILLALVGMLLGGVAGIISDQGFQAGLKIGQLMAIIICLVISFLILNYKKSLSPGNVILALLSGILAMLGGGLLGLIPVAYLTTLAGQKASE